MFALISGLFPVISWVLVLKSLIINTIHFCRLWVFLSESGFSGFYDLQDVGCLGVGILLLCVFIYSLCLISGLFPVISWVLALKSLIINTIHFSGMHAIAGGLLWCGTQWVRVGCYGNCCCDDWEVST